MTERESGWRAGSQAAGWKGERQKKERRYKSALGTRRKARAQARREWLWLMGWHGANVSNIDDCLNGRPAAAGTMRFNYPLHKNTDGWAKLIRKRCLSSTMERVEGSAGGIVTGPAAPWTPRPPPLQHTCTGWLPGTRLLTAPRLQFDRHVHV